MYKLSIPIFATLCTLLWFPCSFASELTRVQTKVEKWAARNSTGIKYKVDKGLLRTTCFGDCYENPTVLNVTNLSHGDPYYNSRFYMFLSFDPKVLLDINLESLRKNFKYISFSFRVFAQNNWEVTLEQNGLIRRNPANQHEDGELVINSFKNGTISFTLRKTARSITAIRKNTKDCPNIADRALPKNCFFNLDVNIPMFVQVSLPFPTREIDCTNSVIRNRKFKICDRSN